MGMVESAMPNIRAPLEDPQTNTLDCIASLKIKICGNFEDNKNDEIEIWEKFK